MPFPHRAALNGALLLLALGCLTPPDVQAQGRGRGGGTDVPGLSAGATLDAVSFSVEVKTQIGDFYASRPVSSVEGLPPGIRRNLARGKALPPGIARKTPPPELVSRVHLPSGYELVEVGLDVLLVEVATKVIHDVLMDVVR